MLAQLCRERRIQPLSGFGYAGVAVKANRKYLLCLLRRGLRGKQLVLPRGMGQSNRRISLSKKTV